MVDSATQEPVTSAARAVAADSASAMTAQKNASVFMAIPQRHLTVKKSYTTKTILYRKFSQLPKKEEGG
jgi:hypothetical protein